MEFAHALEQLRQSLSGSIQTDVDSLRNVSCDGLKISFMPAAHIVAAEAADVGKTLRIAHENHIPVVVRGAGSTLTGSATPYRGGWVLDVSRLNSIRIDPVQKMAFVGAGAVLRDIDAAAASRGLFYPPDPSSHRWCTAGGTIACNAGGLRCVKYGVTRDYVIALKGYLPTGEYVELGRAVRKFATGFNLRDLWIGSEGMLGVITEAVLRLIPRPKVRWTLLCGFSSDGEALRFALDLLSSGINPSILEFIDSLSVKGAERATGHQFFPGQSDPAVILLELDGQDMDALEREAKTVIEKAQAVTSNLRHSFLEVEGERLWEVRRKCSGAMFQLADTKLNEDVVVPLQEMPALIAFIHGLRANSGLPIAVFGHAGDGNLHINIMYDKDKPGKVKRAREALDALMHKVIALGGAISGEHGIGLAKSAYFSDQIPPVQVAWMKGIKNLIDPHGILNPGKIFEPFHPWEHAKIDISFPWDHR